MNIAVIPARGGSKRIPRKNIRELSGLPLIAWPIRMCLASGLFSSVIVSTDDPEIAEIARAYGADTPFVRPPEIADDHATTAAVIAHAANWLADHEVAPEYICCVYPACAFLDADDLAGALAVLTAEPKADYAATIARYPHPIQRALTVEDGMLRFLDPAAGSTRTQDLPPRWHDAGQFYWGRTEAWRAERPILATAVGFEVDGSRVCDIDTEADWRRAELLHRLLLER